jgi:glutathione S-transferase
MVLVHHLRVGRSVFAVWLLEELGIDYELKIYDRNENGRAPEALKQAHPLGKSPVIETEGFTLSESGAITSYLLDKYDTDNKLGPASEPAAKAQWLQWLHYSEASAFAPILIKLLLMREQQPHPPVVSAFSAAEVALQLNYIQDFLADKTFLMGDELKAPDFGMCFVLQLAQKLGELAAYPKLAAYLERNLASPGFKRAMEKTGG